MHDLLRKLGLNKYETNAYLTLLRIGASGAYNLSHKSEVPFGRIYDALKTLEEKGLVEVVPGKPKKYKAKDAKEALNGLIDDEENKLENVRKEVNEAVKNIHAEEGRGAEVTISYGRNNFAKRVSEHFNYETEFWATSEGLRLQDWRPTIMKKYDERASTRYILIDEGKADKGRIKELRDAGVNVKHYSLPGVRILVSDEELVTISIQDNKKEWVNIEAKNELLGKAIMKMLKTVWSNA